MVCAARARELMYSSTVPSLEVGDALALHWSGFTGPTLDTLVVAARAKLVCRTQAVRSDGHSAGHGVQCTFKKQNDGCGHQKRGWIQILYERCRRRLSFLSHGFSGARATPTMSESDPNTQSLTRGGNDGMSWETLFVCYLDDVGSSLTI